MRREVRHAEFVGELLKLPDQADVGRLAPDRLFGDDPVCTAEVAPAAPAVDVGSQRLGDRARVFGAQEFVECAGIFERLRRLDRVERSKEDNGDHRFLGIVAQRIAIVFAQPDRILVLLSKNIRELARLEDRIGGPGRWVPAPPAFMNRLTLASPLEEWIGIAKQIVWYIYHFAFVLSQRVDAKTKGERGANPVR